MLFKGSQDLAHLLLNERCHILAKRHERFLLLREVAAELVHLAAILLVLLRELARKLLLRICELAQQVSAEVFHLILVLPPLLRKLGVVLLNLVRLVTYLLGQRFASPLLLLQGALQLVALHRELTAEILFLLLESRRKLLKGSTSLC